MKKNTGSKKRTPQEIKAILLAEKEKEQEQKKQKLVAEQKAKLLSYFKQNLEFFLFLLTRYYPANDSFIKINFTTHLPFSFNKYLRWTEGLLSKYKDEWDWEALSHNSGLPWSEKLIEKYEDKWDWEWLSANTGIPWTAELIEKYQDKWDWEALSDNPNLPWSDELIARYEENWDWEKLSGNEGLAWSQELIDKYFNRWNWMESGLSGNRSLPWGKAFIEKYIEKWFWLDLCANPAIPWTYDWLLSYENFWKEEQQSLFWLVSPHPTIFSWNRNFISEHADEWHWGDEARPGLSSNSGLPWSEELIRYFEDKWDWSEGLSANPYLPWSFDFYLKYEKKWNIDALLPNYAFWEKAISPYFDDMLIEEFFDYLSENA